MPVEATAFPHREPGFNIVITVDLERSAED